MVKGTTKHVSFAIAIEEEDEEKKEKKICARSPMRQTQRTWQRRRRQQQLQLQLQQTTEPILVECVMETTVLPRITRAFVMGAFPMVMLLAMMQLATSSTSIEQTLVNTNARVFEDISIAALSEDQQGLWTIKMATKSFKQDIHVKEGEEQPTNRAWRFSLSMIIPSDNVKDVPDPNVSFTILDTTMSTTTTTTTKMMNGNMNMNVKQHPFVISANNAGTDLVDEHQVIPADEVPEEPDTTIHPTTFLNNEHVQAQAQEEKELEKHPELSMEVEPISLSRSAADTKTLNGPLRKHGSSRDQYTTAPTIMPSTNIQRRLQEKHLQSTGLSVQGYVTEDHPDSRSDEHQHQAQPGTELYGQSSSFSRVVGTHSNGISTGQHLWQTQFAQATMPIQPQLVPEGHEKIDAPSDESNSLFGLSSQSTSTQNEEKDQIVAASNQKPIMYTFFTPIEDGRKQTGMSPEADEILLTLWNNEWSNAGWKTRVLTIDTAKMHPDFEKLNKKLSSLEKAISTYDRFCFLRWLAMAIATQDSAGGWMSDYDTFPLHFFDCKIPNGGRLTVHEHSKNGGVPSLVSGSPLEWDRLAKELIHNAYLHRDKRFWSDMFALHDIYVMSGKTIYMMEHNVVPALVVMRNQGKEDRICRRADDKYAIHFSHYALENGNLESMNANETMVGSKPEHRSAVAQEWLKKWRMLCSGGKARGLATT